MKTLLLSVLGSAACLSTTSAAYIYDAAGTTSTPVSDTNWYGSIFTTNQWFSLTSFAVFDPDPAGFTPNIGRQIIFGTYNTDTTVTPVDTFTVNNTDAAAIIMNPLGAAVSGGSFRERPAPTPLVLAPGSYFVGYRQSQASKDNVLSLSGVTIDPAAISYLPGSIAFQSGGTYSGSEFGTLSQVSTAGTFVAAMPSLALIPEASGSMMAVALGGMLTGFRLRRRNGSA